MKFKDGYERVNFIIRLLKPIIVLLILGLLYLLFFRRFRIGIPCIFYTITGWKCPGCGMTHALSVLSKGDIKAAWDYNALSITALPVLCTYLFYRWVRVNLGKGEGFHIWEYVLLVLLFVSVVGYGIIRNII